MTNGLSSIADSLVETSGLGHIRSNRNRHSLHTTLPVPQLPQHTNQRRHSRHLSVDGAILQSDKRNSQTNLAIDLSSLTIEFEGGTHVIIRPNRIVRGKVILNATERLYASRIKIKFRAEEVALVRVNEGDSDRLHESITTFFEVDWKLWGEDSTAYSQAGWKEIEAGTYEFPFALKFPNVNYPPSMEEPKGFGIRYVWLAKIDGPALQSGLKSRDYLTPYRPIIVATPDRQWQFKKTLVADSKKNITCDVLASLNKQSYCPDEPFSMNLKLTLAHPDSRIISAIFKFRKHHQGKMLVQKGTAFSEYIRSVLQGTLLLTGHQIEHEISFNVPTRLVSPSFISHHTRVFYDLQFQLILETGSLFKSSQTLEFSIPLTIANLPYDHLLRVPDLTSIGFYKDNKECPEFFDPNLEEPPEPSANVITSLVQQLTSTPRDEPPNYFSLPDSHLNVLKERKEKTAYFTRAIKNGSSDLPEATVVQGLFDESW